MSVTRWGSTEASRRLAEDDGSGAPSDPRCWSNPFKRRVLVRKRYLCSGSFGTSAEALGQEVVRSERDW
jgi:hypothetical protein